MAALIFRGLVKWCCCQYHLSMTAEGHTRMDAMILIGPGHHCFRCAENRLRHWMCPRRVVFFALATETSP